MANNRDGLTGTERCLLNRALCSFSGARQMRSMRDAHIAAFVLVKRSIPSNEAEKTAKANLLGMIRWMIEQDAIDDPL